MRVSTGPRLFGLRNRHLLHTSAAACQSLATMASHTTDGGVVVGVARRGPHPVLVVVGV